jgi:hypothetical protein
MSGIKKIIEQLNVDWSVPKTAIHSGKPVAVPLVCRFDSPATRAELDEVSNRAALPSDVLELWRCANGASLFADETYGQWGLHLWSARASIDETEKFAVNRRRDFRRGDLVVGEFLGDSDLLLVRCDPAAEDYGSVLVALPLDDRSEWDQAASSIEAFLLSYARTHGEKFWR